MASIVLPCCGVLFDMDGVLISSTGADERCWHAWARHHGMEAQFSVQSTHGRRAIDTLRALRPDLDPVPELRRLEDYDAEDYSGLRVYPGVASLLASLPPERWTIVTSATERLLAGRMREAALPMPPALVTAETVSDGKPHPEPYLAGARLLSCAPADCVVIEDSPAGVASGKAAGCRVLAVINSHRGDELAAADWRIGSLEQVRVALVDHRIELHVELD